MLYEVLWKQRVGPEAPASSEKNKKPERDLTHKVVCQNADMAERFKRFLEKDKRIYDIQIKSVI